MVYDKGSEVEVFCSVLCIFFIKHVIITWASSMKVLFLDVVDIYIHLHGKFCQ